MRYDPVWAAWVNQHGYDLARPVPQAVFLSRDTMRDMGLAGIAEDDVIINVFGTNLRPQEDWRVFPGHLLVRMTNGDLKTLEITLGKQTEEL